MTTDTQSTYEMLRHGLIWGRWQSGERLIPLHLKEEFGCTSSVLREAMLRLAGEGLIVSQKNHGFSAVAHSRETFREAAHMRLVLEREAVELSLKNGDFEWEIAVTSAHRKLAHVEQQMMNADGASHYVRHWSLQDWEFHSTLMQACGSELLMKTYKTAFDTFRMYAVAEIENFGFSPQVTAKEHQDIHDAAINRDLSACIAAVETHVTLFCDGNRSSEPMPPKTLGRTGQRKETR